MVKLRAKLFDLFENEQQDNTPARAIALFIYALIILNTVAIVLETVESIYSRWHSVFYLFELVSVVIFTIEYLIRLWVSVERKKYSHPILGRILFFFTPLALIDFFAVMPFYLAFFVLDLRFLRIIRLIRIFRVLKIGRYSSALKSLGRVFMNKKEELGITFAFVLILLILTSTLMYFVENEAQPDVFKSIPDAMWWSITTLTTVGYGDMFPITGLGKFLASIVAVLGIAMFALPTGILGAGFVEEISENKIRTCPHCHKEIDF